MVRTVGVLVFEGFEDLDVFGPVSLLACPRLDGAYRITTVAARPGPVASSAGVATVAAHGFADCPPLDVLLVPGAHSAGVEKGHCA